MNKIYSEYEIEMCEKLDYLIDILRDIRAGLSLALGEDLSSYSDSAPSVEEGVKIPYQYNIKEE
jgi:hypothetical protein